MSNQANFINATVIPVNGGLPGAPGMSSIEKNAMPGKEEDKSLFEASVPMNRCAKTSEIANLVTFLASDKASYISGSYYHTDGEQGTISV